MKSQPLREHLLLILFTFGLYVPLWLITRRRQMDAYGFDVCPGWLLAVPVVHVWSWHAFARGTAEIVAKPVKWPVYVLLLALPPVGTSIAQWHLNRVSRD